MAFAYNYLGTVQKAKEYIDIGIEHSIQNKDIEAFKEMFEFIMSYNNVYIGSIERVLEKPSISSSLISSKYAIKLMKFFQINNRSDLIQNMLSSYQL